MEGLPECLPVGQVTLKSYLPDLKIFLSRTTRRDFCRALLLYLHQLINTFFIVTKYSKKNFFGQHFLLFVYIPR